MAYKTFRYGRCLEDFKVGSVYEHPWEVTVDGGASALFQASFLDATPVYASSAYARDLGFRERPLHPLLLLNLGLSFSVHDVSEQAIAHLAYIDVRFPAAAYAGDTFHSRSVVLGVKPTSAGDRGVVHVATSLHREDESIVCSFERRALVRSGAVEGRVDPPYPPFPAEEVALLKAASAEHRLPPELRDGSRFPARRRGFAGFAEDFAVGDIITCSAGRTVSEAEHMQLTDLVRNSHPLHFDEVYCKGGASFAGTRVVYGGLVFAWVASLASRDTCGNVVWDLGYDQGAHPNGVVAGDTLFAASKVLAVEPHDEGTAAVTFRLVGTKNEPAGALLDKGADLFTTELAKKDGKVAAKVLEIDRKVLMRRRP